MRVAVEPASMSLAAETREAVRAHPFLYEALRAGVLNYTAAARYLSIGDEETVAAALRRYAENLPPPATEAGTARVAMRRGLGLTTGPDEALVTVGDVAIGPADDGALTAVLAVGDVHARQLGRILRRLDVAETDVSAAAVAGDTLAVVTPSRHAADVLRIVEAAVS